MAKAKARLKKEKAEEMEEEELLGSPAKTDKQDKAQNRGQKVSFQHLVPRASKFCGLSMRMYKSVHTGTYRRALEEQHESIKGRRIAPCRHFCTRRFSYPPYDDHVHLCLP